MSDTRDPLAEALRRARPVTDGRLYVMIGIDREALPRLEQLLSDDGAFQAVFLDSWEITLVLPQSRWEALAGTVAAREVSTGWRLITFDAALAHDLVGFMAAISGRLAQIGISLMAFSAFQRDHILVRADAFERAWAQLTGEQPKNS